MGKRKESISVPLAPRSREGVEGSDSLCLFITWAPNVHGFTQIDDRSFGCFRNQQIALAVIAPGK